METIILKNNKYKLKKIMKKVAITILILLCILIISNFRIKYEYYKIDNNLHKTVLGVSSKDNLMYEAELEKFNEIEKQGYEIGAYNYMDIVDYKKVLKWNFKLYNDKKIKKKIQDSIIFLIPAYKMEMNDDVYYVTEEQKKEIDEKTDGGFVFSSCFINVDKIMTKEQMEKLINKD